MSEQRAQSVLAYLEQAGVAEERLSTAVGSAEPRPAASPGAPDSTPAGGGVDVVISSIGT